MNLIDVYARMCAWTQTHTHPFYDPPNFVWDYPGTSVPEPIWISLKQWRREGGRWAALCKTAFEGETFGILALAMQCVLLSLYLFVKFLTYSEEEASLQ